MVVGKIVPFVHYFDLVHLLEVLFAHELIVVLGGEYVEGNFFQVIRIIQVSSDGQHTLEGIHKFYCRTKFRALNRVISMQFFIPAVHAIDKTVAILQSL